MIFISHTSSDKQLIEPIANILAKTYGNENVFYDSWSIQPGEDIIDKMNSGLEKCRFFFFFMSSKSLTSQMVKLEWQNILMKSSKNTTIKFIPVKIDDCNPPVILLQKLFIDVYSNGLDVGIRQMIDVIEGINTYKPQYTKYENVECSMKEISRNEINIIITAKAYMEPIANFLFLTNNSDDVSITVKGESMLIQGYNRDIKLNNGTITNGYLIGVKRALTPKFPIEIDIKSSSSILDCKGILRQESPEQWVPIPTIGFKINVN